VKGPDSQTCCCWWLALTYNGATPHPKLLGAGGSSAVQTKLQAAAVKTKSNGPKI